MKKLIALCMFAIMMVSCESPLIVPPDEPILFTDITYSVEKTGTVEFADIIYGDIKKSNPNDPNELVWEYVLNPGTVLPKSFTVNTCTGHGVKLSALSTGHSGSSVILKIFDDGELVRTAEYESNGFLWGGIIEYFIPGPQ